MNTKGQNGSVVALEYKLVYYLCFDHTAIALTSHQMTLWIIKAHINHIHESYSGGQCYSYHKTILHGTINVSNEPLFLSM